MIYIALLRGINVGGNNKVDMKLLKQTFEKAGMKHVTTYINSGNIIFSSEGMSHQELADKLEQGISADFGLNIRVLIRNLPEIREVMKVLPEHWTNDAQMKGDVLFLWDEINDRSVLDQIPINPEIDTVLFASGVILYSVSKANASRSGLIKLVGTKLYKHMTVRNVNTTRKIHQLMEAAAEQEIAAN
ncbi:DUF1697 domain-containing protein [Paenibacillus jiagnxiensis]|uniref:DUF1697 domain-containing protein n=1 Tax=Paenibacillus jiagnxiensis TaxID=3228926 RepID=UPI00339E1F51